MTDVASFICSIGNNGSGEPIKLKYVNLPEGTARYFASLLYKEADKRNIYDEDISKIDFDSELNSWDYFYDEDEEDDEYEYEDEED